MVSAHVRFGKGVHASDVLALAYHHTHQLDVIERALMLWSIEGDTVGSPFGGVGSEPFCAVSMGRKAVACELKESYYRQAVRNVESGVKNWRDSADQKTLF